MKYRLGDICTITKGGIGIMKAVPGPYTMVALGESDKTHIEYQFDAKAVIIPLVSSTGHGHASMKRVKYYEGKFALGNILCAVIPNDETLVLAKYLHIYLHWNRKELLVSQMKGMANVSLPMNRIADVSVTVPSIDKQIKIIELEKKLAERELEVDKLFADQLAQVENLNQAILQDAVQGKLVPQDKKDEPSSELLKRIKAEKVKSSKKEKPLPSIKAEEIPFEIPENWVWCRLGEICEINPRNKAEDNVKAGFIPMPLVSQLIGINPSYEIKTWVSIKKGFTHFANNDVVVAKITPCFENSKAGIIKDLPNGIGAGTTELNVLRVNKYVLPEYIYSFVKRKDFIKKGKRIMKGVAGQQRVPTKYFHYTLIPLPPLSEQKRITVEIEKQLAKTKQLKEHIIANQQATEQLLKALLHQAFEDKQEESTNSLIEYKPKICTSTEKAVLAGHIINLTLSEDFGRVKFQKLLHLTEYHCKISLGSRYVKKVAGPHDEQLIKEIESALNRYRFYEIRKSRDSQKVSYTKLSAASELDTLFAQNFTQQANQVNDFLSKFKGSTWEQCEIISTLYAVWNNRIIQKKEVTDEALKQDFLDWDTNKKKYKSRIDSALKWMRKESIVPDGWGALIEEPKQK